MPKKIDVQEVADYADLSEDEVKNVLCYLVDDGWLFSSHVEQNIWEREAEA
jgi:hypothetical protein